MYKELAEDLLVTALEGGSNYWYMFPEFRKVDGFEGFKDNNKGTPLSVIIFKWVDTGHEFQILDYETEEEVGKLTKSSMKDAFEKMKEDSPHQFNDLSGWDNGETNWDAETADVWFQYAVMGEVTFA